MAVLRNENGALGSKLISESEANLKQTTENVRDSEKVERESSNLNYVWRLMSY